MKKIFVLLVTVLFIVAGVSGAQSQGPYRGPTIVVPPPPGGVKALSAMPEIIRQYYEADPVERRVALESYPSAPRVGVIRIPVLLIEFPDQKHSLSVPEIQEIFDRVTEYFEWASYGQVHLEYEILTGGWLMAPHESSRYYGGWYDYPDNVPGLVEWGLKEADTRGVDFRPYGNGDRFGDAVAVIQAGVSEDTPVQGAGYSWKLYSDVYVDGIEFRYFHTTPEWRAPGCPIPMGVLAHEGAHDLWFWWDLYAPEGQGFGLGPWSLMSGGVWNGDPMGESPAFADPFHTVSVMGWVKPMWITSPSDVQLKAYEEGPNVVGLRLNDAEILFGINVTPADYDAALPAWGLLWFHVDQSVEGQHFNGRTDQPKCSWYRHYMVSVVQADGQFELEREIHGKYGPQGDPFPGSTGRREFRSSGAPPTTGSFRDCTSAFNIFEISDPGEVITFRVITYRIYLPLAVKSR